MPSFESQRQPDIGGLSMDIANFSSQKLDEKIASVVQLIMMTLSAGSILVCYRMTSAVLLFRPRLIGVRIERSPQLKVVEIERRGQTPLFADRFMGRVT